MYLCRAYYSIYVYVRTVCVKKTSHKQTVQRGVRSRSAPVHAELWLHTTYLNDQCSYMNLGYNYSPITHSSKVYVKGKYNEGNFQGHPLFMHDVLTRGCSVGTNPMAMFFKFYCIWRGVHISAKTLLRKVHMHMHTYIPEVLIVCSACMIYTQSDH